MSDTRDELRRDQWIQDHKFECCTCARRPEDPLCADCEGQNWKEKDWALEKKKILQQNMEMLRNADHGVRADEYAKRLINANA